MHEEGSARSLNIVAVNSEAGAPPTHIDPAIVAQVGIDGAAGLELGTGIEVDAVDGRKRGSGAGCDRTGDRERPRASELDIAGGQNVGHDQVALFVPDNGALDNAKIGVGVAD